jgi:hypothetical protein
VDTPELGEVGVLRSREDLNPFPPLPSHFGGQGFQFLGYQPIELRGIGQITFAFRLEQISFDQPTRTHVGLNADKPRAWIAGGIDHRFRESAS